MSQKKTIVILAAVIIAVVIVASAVILLNTDNNQKEDGPPPDKRLWYNPSNKGFADYGVYTQDETYKITIPITVNVPDKISKEDFAISAGSYYLFVANEDGYTTIYGSIDGSSKFIQPGETTSINLQYDVGVEMPDLWSSAKLMYLYEGGPTDYDVRLMQVLPSGSNVITTLPDQYFWDLRNSPTNSIVIAEPL